MYIIIRRKLVVVLYKSGFSFLAPVLLSSLVMIVSSTIAVYAQVDTLSSPQSLQGPNIILLSQRYNEDSLVGEVMNNGTAIAEFVKVSASFYDANGNIVGRATAYADPHTLNPGDRSPFEIFISDEAIKQDAKTYEFILQWRDESGTEDSKRVLAEEANQPIANENIDEDDQDNEDDNSGNDGNNDNDNNNDDPLEELGNMLGF